MAEHTSRKAGLRHLQGELGILEGLGAEDGPAHQFSSHGRELACVLPRRLHKNETQSDRVAVRDRVRSRGFDLSGNTTVHGLHERRVRDVPGIKEKISHPLHAFVTGGAVTLINATNKLGYVNSALSVQLAHQLLPHVRHPKQGEHVIDAIRRHCAKQFTTHTVSSNWGTNRKRRVSDLHTLYSPGAGSLPLLHHLHWVISGWQIAAPGNRLFPIGFGTWLMSFSD